MNRFEIEINALRDILNLKLGVKSACSKYVDASSKEEFFKVYSRVRSILKYIYRNSYKVSKLIGEMNDSNEEVFLLLLVMQREVKAELTENEYLKLVNSALKINNSFLVKCDEETLKAHLLSLKNEETAIHDIKDDVVLTSILSNVPKFIVKKYFDKYSKKDFSKHFLALEKEASNYVKVNTNKISSENFLRENFENYEKVEGFDDILRYTSSKAIQNTVEYKIGRVSTFNIGYLSLLNDIEDFYRCNLLYIDEEGRFDLSGLIKLKLDKNEGNVHSYFGSRELASKSKINNDRINAKKVDVNGDKMNLLVTYHPYNSSDIVVLNEKSSNFGLMKRFKNYGISLTKEELRAHRKRELADLIEASKYVSLGGDLIYFVNSFLDEETKDVINRFLKEHNEFILAKERTFYPSDSENSDGSYYAIMRKG